MPKPPVCVQCQVELRCKATGVDVEEMADTERPYRVWNADVWVCPSCAFQIVFGFAKTPIAEHFDADYQGKRAHVALQYWPRPDMVPAKASA